MQPDFSAAQTCWRSRESGANHSLPEFPANREFNREFCKFWGSKTALLISKLYISEGNKRSGISPSREFPGMYQGIGFSYQRCVQAKLLAEAELLKPGSIDPGTCAGHAFLPERIPTAHACHDIPLTTSQSSGREAGDPRG